MLFDDDLVVGLCLSGDYFIGHHGELILARGRLRDLASLIAADVVLRLVLRLGRLGCLGEARQFAAKSAEALCLGFILLSHVALPAPLPQRLIEYLRTRHT